MVASEAKGETSKRGESSSEVKKTGSSTNRHDSELDGLVYYQLIQLYPERMGRKSPKEEEMARERKGTNEEEAKGRKEFEGRKRKLRVEKPKM